MLKLEIFFQFSALIIFRIFNFTCAYNSQNVKIFYKKFYFCSIDSLVSTRLMSLASACVWWAWLLPAFDELGFCLRLMSLASAKSHPAGCLRQSISQLPSCRDHPAGCLRQSILRFSNRQDRFSGCLRQSNSICHRKISVVCRVSGFASFVVNFFLLKLRW